MHGRLRFIDLSLNAEMRLNAEEERCKGKTAFTFLF